jgi:hypothetical protein
MKKATAQKPLIEKRIRKHPFLNKRYFSDKYGFFTVKKIWNVHYWCEHSEPHEDSMLKFEIMTYKGKYIVNGYDLEEHCFRDEYVK